MIETRPSAFEPSADQRAIGEVAREVAAREIAPHIVAWDRGHVFPRALYAKLTDAGLMGMLVPERYGGVGADYMSYALAIEELARVDAGTAVTVSVHSMICNAIATLGTDEQKDAWLERLAAQDVIAGFGLTEPDAGSDAAAIRSGARRDGEGWVLSGRKQWCTNGGHAGVMMAMFRTGGAGAKGISAFLVDSAAPGIVVEKVTEKLGIHTSNTVDLAFDDVRVPAAALLGPEGAGLSSALATLTSGRIGIAAQACGILAACLDASVAFAKERPRSGGRSATSRASRSSSPGWRPTWTRRGCWCTARRRWPTPAGRSPPKPPRPSCSRRPRPASTPRKRCRSTAARATPRSSRSSATSATPRSPRSTRAPGKSSS